MQTGYRTNSHSNARHTTSDGKTLISTDGMRAFRPPSWKPDLGKFQANFEYWVDGQVTRRPIGNGHFDITDMGP